MLSSFDYCQHPLNIVITIAHCHHPHGNVPLGGNRALADITEESARAAASTPQHSMRALAEEVEDDHGNGSGNGSGNEEGTGSDKSRQRHLHGQRHAQRHGQRQPSKMSAKEALARKVRQISLLHQHTTIVRLDEQLLPLNINSRRFLTPTCTLSPTFILAIFYAQ